MAAERWRSIVVAMLVVASGHAQSLLQRTVDVTARNVKLSEALHLIAQDGKFRLSYNTTVLNGDSIVDVRTGPVTAERALRSLLGQHRELRESGEHVIILGERRAKRKFIVTGSVVDAQSGHAIARASAYEVREHASALSDANGTFNVEVSGRQERTALRISRVAYRDTIVFVDRSGNAGRIALQPKDVLPLLATRRPDLEDLDLPRALVRGVQAEQAANLGMAEERAWQVSFVPTLGTNGKVSGAMVNRTSLNVIGGYSRGLNGFELGGVFNIERRDVKGVQIAGLTNLVGGSTNGAQVAGAVNHTMRSFNGLQLSGLANVVWDTLSGVQVAGAVNVVKGGMFGTQVSGLLNVTTQGCDGAQLAGALNVTLKEVRSWQGSGLLNYGWSVSGAQVAGGLNVVIDSVGGGQVAGLMNYGRDVTGGQVAGFLNVALRSVRGGQLGFLNIARRCEGGQVGAFNIADTITGASVGFFSFAWRGYHRFDVHGDEVFPVSVMFRTGTHRFYNAFSYAPPLGDGKGWAMGYGVGTEIGYPGKHTVNIEFDVHHMNERANWLDAVNLLGTLHATYGFTIAERLVLSAGPSANIMVSDWRRRNGDFRSEVAPRATWEGEGERFRWQGWIGFRAGVGVRF